MRRTVLVFGLIAGAILSVMMLATMPFHEQIGFERGMVVGYTIMVLAFLMVFFGIRSYRENVGGGAISFGRGCAVGSLITLIASLCYVATWQYVSRAILPDYGETYAAHVLEKERAKGASEAELAAKRADMARFQELYKNPLINIAFTLVEPLPVGLIFSLVSAGILRRKRAGVSTEHYANAGR